MHDSIGLIQSNNLAPDVNLKTLHGNDEVACLKWTEGKNQAKQKKNSGGKTSW